MNVIVIEHSRRQAGADKETRDALGYNRRDSIIIAGQNGRTVNLRLYKVPQSVSGTLGILRERQGGNKNYVYLPKSSMVTLGVSNGQTVEVEVKAKPVSPIATTPGYSPTAPRGEVKTSQKTGQKMSKSGTTITDQIRSVLPTLGNEFSSTQIADAIGKKASNIWGNINSLRKSREIVLVRTTRNESGVQSNIWRRNSEEI